MLLSNRFFNLPLNQFRVFLQIALMLPLTGISLKIFGFRPVLGALRWFSMIQTDAVDDVFIDLIRRWVRLAKQNDIGTCLSRSLVMWWILRRHGIDADLHIGTCKEVDKFKAHAWVEYQGRPLNAHFSIRQRYAAFQHQFNV